MNVATWFKVILLTVLATGITVEQHARYQSHHTWAMPGRLIDVGGGRRIQMDCRGSGSPTVVLESGLDTYGTLSWATVHDSMAKTTRVCAYSRAGVMWSDAPNRAFDSRDAAHDLHAALTNSGEAGPWVMVGHSIGAAYIMTFTQLYDGEVGGLIFVDGSHPDQFAQYRIATGKDLTPSATLSRVASSLAWTGLLRVLPTAPSPASWTATMTEQTSAFFPTSLRATAAEAKAIPVTLARAGEMRSFGDRPLVALTAGDEPVAQALKMMGLTNAQGDRIRATNRALHDDQAAWSSHGWHEVVRDAAHYIHFFRPDVVTAIVREVVGAVRAGNASMR